MGEEVSHTFLKYLSVYVCENKIRKYIRFEIYEETVFAEEIDGIYVRN